MADEMGGWRRHTEGRCRKRSITTGLNAEEYCKRCWGEKVWESIEEERRRETEEWIREREEERLQEEGPQPPPTLEEEVAALKERVTKLENILGYGEIVWRSESGH